jgi:poly(U)-binding-splicing factor PUF60
MSSARNSIAKLKSDQNEGKKRRDARLLAGKAQPSGFDTPFETVTYDEALLLPASSSTVAPPQSSSHNGKKNNNNNNNDPERLKRRIYIGSLHYSITETQISLPFSSFGAITRIDMPKEPTTGLSRGYCFIDYESPDAATMAISTMNGFELAGRNIKVGRPSAPAQPKQDQEINLSNINSEAVKAKIQEALKASMKPVQKVQNVAARIYVGGISDKLGGAELDKVFAPFGEIVSTHLVTDSATGKHKGYAFIEFSTVEASEMAITGMNGFTLFDRTLKVNRPTSQTKSTAVEEQKQIQQAPTAFAAEENSTCIRLCDLIDPSEVDDSLVLDVQEEARVHGDITSAKVVVQGERVDCFLVYTDAASAKKAREDLDHREFGSRVITAKFYPLQAFLMGQYTH